MAKEKTEEIPTLPKTIRLQNFKTHDAINIKGKTSGFWDIDPSKSGVMGLTLTYFPEHQVVLLKAPGIRPLLVPQANIPFMAPLGMNE